MMMGMIGTITILGIFILGKIIRMDLHMLIASSSKASPAHHVHQDESHHPFCHHHHHNGRAQGGETGEMNGVADLSSAWQPDKLSPSPSKPLSESPTVYFSRGQHKSCCIQLNFLTKVCRSWLHVVTIYTNLFDCSPVLKSSCSSSSSMVPRLSIILAPMLSSISDLMAKSPR